MDCVQPVYYTILGLPPLTTELAIRHFLFSHQEPYVLAKL